MLYDYHQKAVLITGGTRGIGLATAYAFAARGAQTYLTYRWGSADEDAVCQDFNDKKLPVPVFIEADAGRDADITPVLDRIAESHPRIDAFVSNVCVSMLGGEVMEHQERSMIRSLEYSSWPLVSYTQAINKRFGAPPRYIVATSSDGPDTYLPRYHYIAVAKAVLETLSRYTATHMQAHDCKVNVLRTRGVITDSYKDVFGQAAFDAAKAHPEFQVSTQECAETLFALCSGLFDSMSGQVVTLDKGAGFADNALSLNLFEEVPSP